jgi:hypothetical protein
VERKLDGPNNTPGAEDCWTNGKPRIATEKDLNVRWFGGKPGEYFRCALCGYRFKVGDYWRWQYTNSTPGAGGNPIVCEKCDGPDVIERWRVKCEEFRESFWYFARR